MTLPLVLALDISKTCTGIAFGRPGERPTLLSINGSEIDAAAAMAKLGTWLIEFCRVSRPDWLYYEAALNIIPGEYDAEEQRVKAKGNPQTTITLAKMTGVVEFIAEMKHIRWRTANVQTVRKNFLGSGRPDQPKKHVKAMCLELGWTPKNTDESDAAAVWSWACIQVAPSQAQIVTPMQHRKVAAQMAPAGVFAGGRG
ncbi:hypothetical protein OIU35_31720 [Boseaceae bacterium BT-24-1]|nr:hypothetical protein [Boseaceae bacterium BT-24-1]